MKTFKRGFLILFALLLFFTSGLYGQLTSTSSVSFLIKKSREVELHDVGDLMSSIYFNFDPDSVTTFGIDIFVTDSSTTTDKVTFNVSAQWGTDNYWMEQITWDEGAEWVFPHTAGANNAGVPDSIFRIVFDSPGTGDKYHYRSTVQTIPRFNPENGATIVETHEEMDLAEGDAFFFAFDTSLASANDSLKVAIITPNSDDRIFFRWAANATALSYFAIREEATVASGDTVTIFNADRTSSKTCSAVFLKNILGTGTSGTNLVPYSLGATHKIGGSMEVLNQLILKPETTYLIVVHATAASVVNLRLNWHSHFGLK